MAGLGGRGAVELAERTPSVLVVVDSYPATAHMILRYLTVSLSRVTVDVRTWYTIRHWLYLFSGDRAFPTSELVWQRIDAVNYRIKGGESRIEEGRREAELVRDLAITRSEIIVGRRIFPSENPAVGRVHRI